MTTPLEEIVSGLREAAEKATPGEWAVDGYSTDAVIYMPAGETHVSKWKHLAKCGTADGYWRANAAYIAKANPQALLSVLDAFQAQAARIAELTGECDGLKVSYSETLNSEEQWITRAEAAERDLAAAVEALTEIEGTPNAFDRVHIARECLRKLKGPAK